MFGLALAYGGIGQFVAGIWEFAKGNTFGATAFCSYGGFWISYWYLTGHTDLSGAKTRPTLEHGIGLFLLAWGIFTLYMTVAAIAGERRGPGGLRAPDPHVLRRSPSAAFAISRGLGQDRWLPRVS